MLFSGYLIKLDIDDSILFDEEITPELLHVDDGDKFEVVLVEGRIRFRKLPKT